MPRDALALTWPSQVASNSWNLYSDITHFMGTNCSQEEGVAFSKAACRQRTILEEGFSCELPTSTLPQDELMSLFRMGGLNQTPQTLVHFNFFVHRIVLNCSSTFLYVYPMLALLC